MFIKLHKQLFFAITFFVFHTACGSSSCTRTDLNGNKIKLQGSDRFLLVDAGSGHKKGSVDISLPMRAINGKDLELKVPVGVVEFNNFHIVEELALGVGITKAILHDMHVKKVCFEGSGTVQLFGNARVEELVIGREIAIILLSNIQVGKVHFEGFRKFPGTIQLCDNARVEDSVRNGKVVKT